MIALLQAKAAGLWSRGHIRNNLLAGVVVGIVALPLAMAFAIASGARPEQGLYTAIIAALLTSIFGGTRVQISGPTGAFVAVLSIITTQHGIAGLQIATLMAGVILLVFGFARLGAVIKYIPNPVIVGFTAGIAVIIFVGQWKDFLGLTPASSGLHFHQKLWSLIEALPTINPATTGLALLALAILTFGARYLRRIPAPLIALIVVTVVQTVFQFRGVATIGSAFGGIPRTLPAFSIPSLDLARVLSLVGPAFTIALLGAIESLMSAVVAELGVEALEETGMAEQRPQQRCRGDEVDDRGPAIGLTDTVADQDLHGRNPPRILREGSRSNPRAGDSKISMSGRSCSHC